MPKMDWEPERNGGAEPSESVTDKVLAISLTDLMDRVPAGLRLKLGIAQKIRVRESVVVGQRRVDGEWRPIPGVVFHCDLVHAATVCDVVRQHFRDLGEAPVSVYVLRESAWQRVADAVPLTVLGPDGTVALNPEVFAVKAPQVAGRGPMPRAVEF